jgi:hypothetical protein
MHDWPLFVPYLANAGIALFASWLSVKLALRRFQSEKLFERRLDAYTMVLECLHYVKFYNDRQLVALERGRDIPREAEEELAASRGKGLADLRRLTDVGALLFSAEAVDKLDDLSKELGLAAKKQSWLESTAAEIKAVTKCLSTLRSIAKNDLNA